jgi:hypothetical protein
MISGAGATAALRTWIIEHPGPDGGPDREPETPPPTPSPCSPSILTNVPSRR